MIRRSNIARPSTTNKAAMPRLNHGDELIVPNVPAVRMTISPRTPYTIAIAPPYAEPRRNPRLLDCACAPAPMIARLMGIIGSTHGVRFRARPPISTRRTTASGPRPSNIPRGLIPASAFPMNCRNACVFWYPPVVPATTKPSSNEASSATVFGEEGTGAVGPVGSADGFSPVPNAMVANTSAWLGSGRAGAVGGTTRTIHSTSAVAGG